MRPVIIVSFHESGERIRLYCGRVDRTGAARRPSHIEEEGQLALHLAVYALQFAVGLGAGRSSEYVPYAQYLQALLELGPPLLFFSDLVAWNGDP